MNQEQLKENNLRQEFKKSLTSKATFDGSGTVDFFLIEEKLIDNIADFWLSKFQDYKKELFVKLEEMKIPIENIHELTPFKTAINLKLSDAQSLLALDKEIYGV